jgi:septum formation protein
MKQPEHKIYLASKSPRRRELLRQIGVEFELLLLRDHPTRGPDVDEVVQPGEIAQEYVARVTLEKVNAAWQAMQARRLPYRPVLAADTTVVIGDKILGKPADPTEAAAMLRSLSGQTHQVLTSVALRHDDEVWQKTQRSDVTFTTLSDDAIQAYCATPEPYDKAGGYGIQGKAAIFISHIAGSHSGIMGLPLCEVTQLLANTGLHLP